MSPAKWFNKLNTKHIEVKTIEAVYGLDFYNLWILPKNLLFAVLIIWIKVYPEHFYIWKLTTVNTIWETRCYLYLISYF